VTVARQPNNGSVTAKPLQRVNSPDRKAERNQSWPHGERFDTAGTKCRPAGCVASRPSTWPLMPPPAGAAAFFSIMAMVVIFPGSPTPVVGMATGKGICQADHPQVGWRGGGAQPQPFWRATLVVSGSPSSTPSGSMPSSSPPMLASGRGHVPPREATADLDCEDRRPAHEVADLERRPPLCRMSRSTP
jgi:hypothetical protein